MRRTGALRRTGFNGRKERGRKASPTYDAVGRLQSAWETAGPEVCRQSFDYDRWGNRWFNSACVGVATCNHGFFQDPLAASAQGDYNQATNRLTKTGLTEYADGVGNQTKLGELVLTYDEEGRVATSAIGTTSSAYHTSSTYQYDGEGRRVRKVVEKTVNNTMTTDTTVYVYTAHGELAAEYKGEPQDAGPVRYVAVDALGSTRALTDGAGVVTKCYDFLPFGEPVSQGRSGCYAGSDEVRQKFTGQLRDGETSTVDGNDRDALDYFGARYFSGVQGRFTSPDLPANYLVSLPQSWNKYAYALNNPLAIVDPDGQFPKWIHEQIIDQISGLSDNDKAVLKAASADADSFLKGGQSSSASFKHAMLDGLEFYSAQNDPEKAAQYVEKQLRKAIGIQAAYAANRRNRPASLSPDALYAMGLAIHTVTDSASKFHNGVYAYWYGGFSLMDYFHSMAEPAYYATGGERDKKEGALRAEVTSRIIFQPSAINQVVNKIRQWFHLKQKRPDEPEQQ